MKILICGDRNWGSFACGACTGQIVPCRSCLDKSQAAHNSIEKQLMRFNPQVDIIIHGGARGADSIGALKARLLGWHHSRILAFPAKWYEHGRAAGPIRNRRMLEEKPDIVLAFHPNLALSKGTRNMVEIARKAGIEVEVHDK